MEENLVLIINHKVMSVLSGGENNLDDGKNIKNEGVS